jgi:hypothetical protein
MDDSCQEVASGPTAAPAPTEAGSSQPTEPTGSGVIQVQSSADETRPLWVAHGVLMALAWGVCAPLAIGAVMLRRVSFLANGGCWFKIHFYMNVCNVLFTSAGFFLAVAAMNKQGDDHFTENTHTKAGLAIFLVALFQFAVAFLRPDPPKAPTPNVKSIESPADTVSNNSGPERASGIEQAVSVFPPSHNGANRSSAMTVNESEELDLGRDSAATDSDQESVLDGAMIEGGLKSCQLHHDGEATNKESELAGFEKNAPTKSKVRLAWEISHRFIGIALIGTAWFNCTSGIRLQVENYGEEEDHMAAFWGVTAGISGVLVFMAYVVRV